MKIQTQTIYTGTEQQPGGDSGTCSPTITAEPLSYLTPLLDKRHSTGEIGALHVQAISTYLPCPVLVYRAQRSQTTQCSHHLFIVEKFL